MSLFHIVCRYHHAPHIPVVTAKWLDAVSSTLRFFHTLPYLAAYNSPPLSQCTSRWCWLPTEPYKTKWKEDVPCTHLLPSSPIVVQACGRRPSSSTFASCLCRLGVGIFVYQAFDSFSALATASCTAVKTCTVCGIFRPPSSCSALARSVE
jgi:hypothetical protein